MYQLALLLSLFQPGRSSHVGRVVGPAGQLTRDSLRRFADEYFAKALAESHLSAAAVVFVTDGKVLFSRGYGLANRENGVAVDPSRTLWRLASTSKSLTALGALELTERGRIRLDDDVNTYLRAFKVPDDFYIPVTIRELLRHTSGLDDRLIGDGFIDGTPPSLTAVMAARLPRRIRPAGTEVYSNYDYGLVGAAIEQEAGMPFAVFERDSVLLPLGMRRTTFEQPLPPEWATDLALPYAYSGGAFHRWPVIYHQSSPGGGATATADDMGRYMEFLLDDGKTTRLVSRESIRDAFGIAGLAGTAFDAVGYGWRSRLWNGERAVETDGDLPGYTNLLVLFPERRLGFWVALNSGKNAVTLGFLWAFLDRYFPQPPPRAGGPWSDSIGQFTGTFRPVRYPHDELSKLGIISNETTVEAAPDGTLRFWGERWIRVGPLQFQRESGPLVVTFGRDAAGRIATFENFERIPWYETKNVQIGLVLLFVATFLGVPLIWLVGKWRTPHGRGAATIPGQAASASLLNLAFLAGIVVYFAATPSYDLMLGLSPTLRVLLAFPLIALGLSAWALRPLVLAARARNLAGRVSVAHAVFLVVTIGYLVFLNHWNLIGYRA